MTSFHVAVINRPFGCRYDRYKPADGEDHMDDEATLRQRLAAGEWLTTTEVGVVLHVSRWAVIRATERGWKVGSQQYPLGCEESPGGHRRCDPHDVLAIIAAKDRHREALEAQRARGPVARERRPRKATERRTPEKPSLEDVRRDIRGQLERNEISREDAAEMLRLAGETPPPRADEL